jgi:superfamily II DNA or RNA helicase
MDSGVEDTILPYFGEETFEVDYKRALEDGVISPFKIAFVGAKFRDQERREYDRHGYTARRCYNKLVNDFGFPAKSIGEFTQAAQRAKHGSNYWESVYSGYYLSAMNHRREVLANASQKHFRLAELAPAIYQSNKTIIFTETKDAAEQAVDIFAQYGIPGAALHSQLKKPERRAIFDEFRNGQLRLLAAPRILDEGVDIPAADLAIILASSRSKRQMVQRLGRIVRLKDDRLARLAVLFVEDTSEDPQIGHEGFLELVIPAAHSVCRFSHKSQSAAICNFLNSWHITKVDTLH